MTFHPDLSTLVEDQLTVAQFDVHGDRTAEVGIFNGTFRWTAADPLVISATLKNVPWILSRDLLWHGMFAPTGTGDVQVLPVPGDAFVEVVLRTPSGQAALRLPKAKLYRLLERTFEVVALGAEVCWDEDEVRAWR